MSAGALKNRQLKANLQKLFVALCSMEMKPKWTRIENTVKGVKSVSLMLSH